MSVADAAQKPCRSCGEPKEGNELDSETRKIDWAGFSREVLKPENRDRELCAWLYSSEPHGANEEWHEDEVEEIVAVQTEPSEADTQYQRRFRQVVRGILVVNYFEDPPSLEAVVWHDQYGHIIEGGSNECSSCYRDQTET